MDLPRPLRSLLALAAPAVLVTAADLALGRGLPTPPPWTPWLAGWAAAAGLGVLAAVRLETGRFRAPWLTWVMGALALPVAGRLLVVSHAWGSSGWAAPAVGALVGFYVLSGAWALEAAAEPLPELQGEWQALVLQARQAHASLRQELAAQPAGDPARRGLEERAVRLLQGVESTAHSWSRLERGASPEVFNAIEQRLQAARQQQEATADDQARAEYARTVESLERQKESVQRIRRGTERALARARHQVTVMETARLGVMAYAAQDHHAQGDEAVRLTSLLDSASQDLETAASALEEAEAETFKVLPS